MKKLVIFLEISKKLNATGDSNYPDMLGEIYEWEISELVNGDEKVFLTGKDIYDGCDYESNYMTFPISWIDKDIDELTLLIKEENDIRLKRIADELAETRKRNKINKDKQEFEYYKKLKIKYDEKE